MKNLMPDVAKLLGVEIGEEFKIDNPGNDKIFRLTVEGLLDDDNYLCTGSLAYLLLGRYKIVKLPFKPKKGEHYWYVDNDDVSCSYFYNNIIDYSFYKLGNCFRTKKEAEANADRIRKEIMGI